MLASSWSLLAFASVIWRIRSDNFSAHAALPAREVNVVALGGYVEDADGQHKQ